MSKFDDLEKLQKLKESGTITEEEFKKEKTKILNSNEKKKHKVSIGKTFIVLAIIAAILTIIFVVQYISCDEEYEEAWDNYIDDKWDIEFDYEYHYITQSEYNRKMKEFNEEIDEICNKHDFWETGRFVTGGATIGFIIIGTILIIIEKKKEKKNEKNDKN